MIFKQHRKHYFKYFCICIYQWEESAQTDRIYLPVASTPTWPDRYFRANRPRDSRGTPEGVKGVGRRSAGSSSPHSRTISATWPAVTQRTLVLTRAVYSRATWSQPGRPRRSTTACRTASAGSGVGAVSSSCRPVSHTDTEHAKQMPAE